MAGKADNQQTNSKKKRVPGIPFEKGKSGNPAGRPKKGEALTDILREKLGEMRTMPNGDKVLAREALADTLLRLAIDEQDMIAVKYVYDRVDGKPTETVNQTVKEFNIEVVRRKLDADNA